jgi:hypothetical protein
MYSDGDSSSPGCADPVQTPGGASPWQRYREGREFIASEALRGLRQIQTFRSHAVQESNTGKFMLDKSGS